jgi:hypothetical protein
MGSQHDPSRSKHVAHLDNDRVSVVPVAYASGNIDTTAAPPLGRTGPAAAESRPASGCGARQRRTRPHRRRGGRPAMPTPRRTSPHQTAAFPLSPPPPRYRGSSPGTPPRMAAVGSQAITAAPVASADATLNRPVPAPRSRIRPPAPGGYERAAAVHAAMSSARSAGRGHSLPPSSRHRPSPLAAPPLLRAIALFSGDRHHHES